ncbi:MAG: alpha/beta hydrolase, partial [Chloroflexota bacterium]
GGRGEVVYALVNAKDIEALGLTGEIGVITGLGATKIHAIAHSMGNRLLSNALERLQLEGLPESAARLRQIVFTAPDVDAETFKQLAAAYEGKADQFTLYASSRDFPLELSAFLHGGNRAGEADETDGGPVIVSPIETVDVSAIDTILAGLGHSYFGGNVRVIDDMIEVINKGKRAVERGLTQIDVDGNRRYWQVIK